MIIYFGYIDLLLVLKQPLQYIPVRGMWAIFESIILLKGTVWIIKLCLKVIFNKLLELRKF